jgi:hypothetical protein
MVSLEHVTLDLAKVEVDASKHKAMSHERMLRGAQGREAAGAGDQRLDAQGRNP